MWTQLILHCFRPVSSESPDVKIMAGWEADIQEVPYFVRIEFDYHKRLNGTKERSEDFCGATIIHPRWLLTAGHCLEDVISLDLSIWLVFGVDDEDDFDNMPKNGDRLPRVDLIHCHPEFNNMRVGPPWGQKIWIPNDICLLRVDHTINFGKYIAKAGLPWRAYDKKYDNKLLLVSGYGETQLLGDTSKKLLSTELKLLSHEECESIFNVYRTQKNSKNPPAVYPNTYDRKNQICGKSADEIRRAAGAGDSGGGFIYQDSISNCPIIVGIISAVNIRNATERFTRVSAYQSWIENTMERFNNSKSSRFIYSYPERNRIDD